MSRGRTDDSSRDPGFPGHTCQVATDQDRYVSTLAAIPLRHLVSTALQRATTCRKPAAVKRANRAIACAYPSRSLQGCGGGFQRNLPRYFRLPCGNESGRPGRFATHGRKKWREEIGY